MKILIAFLLLALPLAATEEDKTALRALRAVYEEAVATRNLDLLKPHLADDFSAVMITAHEIEGFTGILDYWKRVEEFLGKDGTYQVAIDPDDSLFQGDMAIAKGRALEKVTRGGTSFEMTSHWTAVARKENGTWKLVRIHATIDPIDNPILHALQGAQKWTFAIAALVIGTLTGFLAARLPRRKAPALA